MKQATSMKEASSYRRKPAWATLLLVSVAVFLLPVAMTGAGVALPEIAQDFHPSSQSLKWVVSGYNVTFAALMLAFGTIADRVGRRRIFQIGITLFGASALVGMLANSVILLDITRVTGGIGAAATLTAGSTLVASRFEGTQRVRAFGIFGTALGAGLAFGPLVSALTMEFMGWRGILLVPTVLGLLVAVFTPMLKESRNTDSKPVDWTGTVTFTLGLVLLIFALVEAPTYGWTSGLVIGSLVATVLLFAGFAVAEKRQRHPMFELSLLRNTGFMGVNAAAVAMAFTLLPLLVLLPTYFSAVKGYSALGAGSVLIIVTIPTLIIPLLAPVIAKFLSVRVQLTAAMVTAAGGMVWLSTIQPHTSISALVGPLLLTGAGYGMTLAIVDGAAISSVDLKRAGMASGMFNAMRLTGDTAAAAVGGSLLLTITSSHLAGKVADPDKVTEDLNGGIHTTSVVAADAFTSALHVVIWISVALALITAPLVWRALRPKKVASPVIMSGGPSSTGSAALDESPAGSGPTAELASEPAGGGNRSGETM
ncbi:MFS transporter [Streptomyces sp. NPDC051569]|uniref:MFS transporter n=1 Tax=Streptomyces sp. NPDC051569 TaxID=3365661 RepID=UPI0037AC8000